MRQIVLECEDSAYEKLMGMIDLCPQVNVVSTDTIVDVISHRDHCMAFAIKTLRDDGVFRFSFDYAWIMMALNEGVVDDYRGIMSPQEFIDYLKELGFNHLPCRTSLYNGYSRTMNRFPDWTFTDVEDACEELRRKNVVKQFLSAYGKAKRGIVNKMLNK